MKVVCWILGILTAAIMFGYWHAGTPTPLWAAIWPVSWAIAMHAASRSAETVTTDPTPGGRANAD